VKPLIVILSNEELGVSFTFFFSHSIRNATAGSIRAARYAAKSAAASRST